MYAFLTSQRVDFGNSLLSDAILHIANVFRVDIGMGDQWRKWNMFLEKFSYKNSQEVI